MKVCEAVTKVVDEWGIPYIYGIPGGQTLYFTTALRDTSVKFIPTRHEGVAAGAADAYGRLTGKPGLCLSTTGPGATNLITSIGGALRDTSPVIAFVFQNTLGGASRGDAQEADHEQLFSSIVKKYIPVRDADSAVWAVREAYRIATTGKPGPVVVDFYRDIIEKGECDYSPLKPEAYACKAENTITNKQLNEFKDLVEKHEKITIYCGGGVKSSHTGLLVQSLAEKLHAPIVTTFNGISSVDTKNKLVLGARTRHGNKVTRAALEEADLVIALGTSFSSVATNRWGLKFKDIIQIDFVAEQIANQYPVVMGICADLNNALTAINELAFTRKTSQDEFTADLQNRKVELDQKIFSGKVCDELASPAAPIAVCKAIKEEMKEDDIICVDAGNPGCWSQILDYTVKNTHMKPVNYGNMGFCIPATLACSMAQDTRKVIGIIGDGSLGMTLGDLETIGRYSKNSIIILLNDGAYGNIKQEILFKFGEGKYNGVDLAGTDYSKVAEVFGIKTRIAVNAKELKTALHDFRDEKGPCMIEVKFDGSVSIWPEAFNWNE